MTILIHSKYTRENSEKHFHKIQWQPYTKTTFEKALNERKPIFLLISAPAWCHWCHVYESEDYLFNEQVYNYINENCIPVFVDSDKRPDLTRQYLEGGWPSTTLLTPNNVRITGFSGPRDVQMMRQMCEDAVGYVNKEWQQAMKKEDQMQVVNTSLPSKEELQLIETQFLSFLQNSFDETYGGFSPGEQQFPTGLTYKYLLEKYEETNNTVFLNMVKITFDNQWTESLTRYKLFDPVEGGFHRYGTQHDWSVPHYEKMLQDQATLIRAYAHLLRITNDERVKTVVMKSIGFVRTKLLSPTGGFYASQDAHLEEEYFGRNEEERNKLSQPFVDKTVKIDANAQMIITFLYLYKTFNNTEYKEIAEKSLAFIQQLLGKDGAYYYYDGQPHLSGLGVANAFALLVFVEAYEIVDDKKYLVIAEQLAEYCLKNLFDNGFIERNSAELENYAPDDAKDSSKSFVENGIFAYCLLKLYRATKKQEYDVIARKTMGCLQNCMMISLDDYYYVLQASKLL